ncbi:MAG: alpha-mannosidase [Calditrichia bacterium]
MTKPTLHLICNAHLDPVWQWQWEEGLAETLSTFGNAVRLLKEHDRLIFNHNEALLYQWVKRYDPALFREIQKLVEAERWCISGGWYLQPDVNLPGTESLIRHIAEGRRFFREFFGVQPRVAYNFDSFGHSGGLPQILVQSGYQMYIHMRPQENDLNLPAALYRWRGVDGTEILAYRIEVGLYHTEYDNLARRLQEATAKALQLRRDVAVFWGIGNHGGGATREDLSVIEEFITQEQRVKIIHSTPERFYQSVKDLAAEAPLVEGELQRVFTGCYTSLSRVKRAAQKSLHQLVQTEALRAASWWLEDQPFPAAEFQTLWQEHLFNDFHDILPGSCVESAEQDALDWYGKVSESLRRLRVEAAVAFNQGPRREAYLPVTILNHSPLQISQPVEFECMISHRPKWEGIWHLRLFNREGKEIPCQQEQSEALLPFNAWRRKICFMADLSPMGVTHFYLEAHPEEKKQASLPALLKFERDPVSGLIQTLSSQTGENVLSGLLMKPLVVEDRGDSWGTDCWEYRQVLGEFRLEPGSSQTLESGPIRTIYQSVYAYHQSKIVMNLISYSLWPVLEYRLRVHWNEQHKRLKLSIPTVVENSTLLCEIPGGVIRRPADGQEHMHGRWFLLDNDRGQTLAVAHNGCHGIDFQQGEVRLSVLRGAAYCHEKGFALSAYPARKFMDQGVHDIRLVLTVGNADEVRKKIIFLADWLNSPPVVYPYLPFGSDSEQSSRNSVAQKSLFRLPTENIRVLACKPSWDGRSLIIRLQEAAGLPTETPLQLFHPSQEIALSFQPLEIKTIRIEKSGHWQEVNLIDEC